MTSYSFLVEAEAIQPDCVQCPAGHVSLATFEDEPLNATIVGKPGNYAVVGVKSPLRSVIDS